MIDSDHASTLLENIDLSKYPPSCLERSHCQPLTVEDYSQNGDTQGIFLEAAGWVKIPQSGDASTRYAPPLAGFVARSLRSCLTDSNSARKMASPQGLRSSIESSNLLDSPSGYVPSSMPPVSPRAMTVAMSRRILSTASPHLDAARQSISEWIKSVGAIQSGEESDMVDIGPSSGRSHTHRGEILISADRQTGSVSFLMTGDAMGIDGPYSQHTKIYEPSKRKLPVAVIFHRGSAVRSNAARSEPKALEKSLFSAIRPAIAEELLLMSESAFNSSMGADSLSLVRATAPPSLYMSLESLATTTTRHRALLGTRPTPSEISLARTALISELSEFDNQYKFLPQPTSTLRKSAELTHPLDILLPAAADFPWIFPSYTSSKVQKGGTLHLHSPSGNLFRGLFSALESSPDFVFHTDSSEGYSEKFRQPTEIAIDSISRELDAPESMAARAALQRARTEILAFADGGTVGFLELIRGAGVVLGDGKAMAPVEAMRVLLGPTPGESPASDKTLLEISDKIDSISSRLNGTDPSAGIGSIRDFCSRVSKKSAIAIELFGAPAVEQVLEAKRALYHAELATTPGKEARCGNEMAALQKAVSDCLCSSFFGEKTGPSSPNRHLVDRLVAAAANSEFVYFAVQAGAEGLLKIGKASDVRARTSDLSKAGHDILALAYIAVPSLPVGDWSLASVPAAAALLGGPSAGKKATLAINRLVGFFGSVESGSSADFFVNAVQTALEGKIADPSGSWQNKTVASLTEMEVVSLLTESKKMRPSTAQAVYGLLSAVHSASDDARGFVEAQKQIREASATVLSHLTSESVWTRVPADGPRRIKDTFYVVDETAQTPVLDEAWPYRIQSGALAFEATLHKKYHRARVHGEWFHLLPAAESVVASAEKMLSTPAVRCCADPSQGSLLPLISNLQSSGVHVCTSMEMLPVYREGYKEAVERVAAEEFTARLTQGKDAKRARTISLPTRNHREIV